MEWSNGTTLMFLDIYQREPIIWDPSHKLHKNRNEVYDAWKRIQTELLSEEIEISIPDLKKKKDSLMATFRNCLSKVNQSVRSGAGADELYKPNWFAYSKMAGSLINHDMPKNTINSENVEIVNVGNDRHSKTQDETSNDDTERTTNKASFKPPVRKKNKTIPEEVIYDKMEKAYDILSKKTPTKREG